MNSPFKVPSKYVLSSRAFMLLAKQLLRLVSLENAWTHGSIVMLPASAFAAQYIPIADSRANGGPDLARGTAQHEKSRSAPARRRSGTPKMLCVCVQA